MKMFVIFQSLVCYSERLHSLQKQVMTNVIKLWMLLYSERAELKRRSLMDKNRFGRINCSNNSWHHAVSSAAWRTLVSHAFLGNFIGILKRQAPDFSHLSHCIKGKSTLPYHSSLSYFQNLQQLNFSLSLSHYSSSASATTTTSSETPSVAEQMAKSTLLNIKPNQNLILDLDSSKYVVSLQPLIECLRLSPLAPTLTMAENVRLVHLSKAFSTVGYQEGEVIIMFDIGTQKTSIAKSRFSQLQGFSQHGDLVDPECISSSAILEMFY